LIQIANKGKHFGDTGFIHLIGNLVYMNCVKIILLSAFKPGKKGTYHRLCNFVLPFQSELVKTVVNFYTKYAYIVLRKSL